MPQSRRWCFTLNNPTDGEETHLSQLGSSNTIIYLVYGREVGQSGTPHFQGFVVFRSNQRLRAAKEAIGNRCHVEVARGTSQQASTYCKKDGDFEEYGELPGRTQGKRNDFGEFKEWVLEQSTKPTARHVAEHFPDLFIKYGRIMEWVDMVYPPPELVTGEPRPWQRDLADRLADDADDRKIIFVVDPSGGCGKSWFVRWWLSREGTNGQRLSIGKRDDLAFAIDESKSVFLFDIPRSQSEFLQYCILEQLKDRLVFSPKYVSRCKMLQQTPHVVVFMNEQPDRNKLSQDRYDVINLYNPTV